MGNKVPFLRKPVLNDPTTSQTSDFPEGPQLEYGIALAQGRREHMEDCATVVLGLPEQDNFAFCGVFDGHGGSMVANYVSEHLLNKIRETEQYIKMVDPDSGKCEMKANHMIEAIPNAFVSLDDDLRKMKPVEEEQVRKSIIPWKQDGDVNYVTYSSYEMGTTASTVIITPKQFYFCNCGDSRAVLISSGKVSFETKDHTTQDESEFRRIEAAGGIVNNGRVDGILAVSRALGDFCLKDNSGLRKSEQKVVATPDVSIIPRNHSTNQYIVIASDGLWGKLSSAVVADKVVELFEQGLRVGQVCDALVQWAIKKGSADNIGVVLIKLLPEEQ